jgi:hypothetical protein
MLRSYSTPKDDVLPRPTRQGREGDEFIQEVKIRMRELSSVMRSKCLRLYCQSVQSKTDAIP